MLEKFMRDLPVEWVDLRRDMTGLDMAMHALCRSTDVSRKPLGGPSLNLEKVRAAAEGRTARPAPDASGAEDRSGGVTWKFLKKTKDFLCARMDRIEGAIVNLAECLG